MTMEARIYNGKKESLQQMVLGKLDHNIQKMKLDHFLHSTQKEIKNG